MNAPPQRHLGLFSATSIGVGAIVGGGILALAGTSFAVAGPGALLAFALNGVIAFITAFSFAELSSANPQSGGTYSFARSTLTVGAAFGVGWVVWFASIVAGALYALGFGSFGVQSVLALWPGAPALLADPRSAAVVALLSVVACVAFLRRAAGTGGNLVNVLKVAVFAILIMGGAIVWIMKSPPVGERLSPFLPSGGMSLVVAMGFTFITFQGFDLIAAVAGEVKEPQRVLPRSMMLSLGAALSIYIPLLLIILVLGVPEGRTIQGVSSERPDTVVAIAAREYLGAFGFWLVMASGILSMLSALLANLFAASRIARAMAGDRTLPVALADLDERRGSPTRALYITGALMIVILVAVGDVGRAGAASSLTFLISFALTHWICILARKRRPAHQGFRVPGWPYLPAVGGLVCAGLAIFQGIVVPAAGLIAGGWLVAGVIAYMRIFGKRARTMDAASEFTDPELLPLRGQSPLVLVPIANPANAASLATVAICLSPQAGRVMMLNVIPPRGAPASRQGVETMTEILRHSMNVGLEAGVSRTEALIAIGNDPWQEIARVARTHRCALTLLGMTQLGDPGLRARIEELTAELPGNVAIVRSPDGWHPRQVRRILVPLGGRGMHNTLRARLLTALTHQPGGAEIEVHYLIVVDPKTSDKERERLRATWTDLIRDESSMDGRVEVAAHEDVVTAVVDAARECDLIVVGLGQVGKKRVFSDFVVRFTEQTEQAMVLIGQRA